MTGNLLGSCRDLGSILPVHWCWLRYHTQKKTPVTRADCVVLCALNQFQILAQLGQSRISKVVNIFYAWERFSMTMLEGGKKRNHYSFLWQAFTEMLVCLRDTSMKTIRCDTAWNTNSCISPQSMSVLEPTSTSFSEPIWYFFSQFHSQWPHVGGLKRNQQLVD